MHIAAVTTWFPTATAPASGVFVARDVAALADAGHDVRVVHLVPPHQDDGVRRTHHGDIPVLRIPMATTRPDAVLRAARALPAALRGAEIVHSMAVSSLLPLSLHRPAVPWVHTEHWGALAAPAASRSRAERLGVPLARGMLRRPDVVAVVSSVLAAAVSRYRAGQVVVVPNIVDVPGPVPRRRVAAGDVRLVGVGALVPNKGPLLAVRTLAELRRRGHDRATMTWVGAGVLAEPVRELAHRLGLADAVALVGSVLPEQVADHIAAADVFLLPTEYETFCVAAAEAISLGRPVVLGAHGGHRDFVTAANGVLVPERTPEAYADAVETTLDRFGDVGAEAVAATVGGRFSTGAFAGAYGRAYEYARSRHRVR